MILNKSFWRCREKQVICAGIRSHGFFDRRWNKYLSFANQFELKLISNQPIVIDHATGLAWHQSGSALPLVYSEAGQWLEDLNKKGYAGYSNWKPPTAKELEPDV